MIQISKDKYPNIQICGGCYSYQCYQFLCHRCRAGNPTAAAAVGYNKISKALMHNEVCELYVRLMCRFSPREVLPFLEEHETYRPAECLAACRTYDVRDASVYLMERMGDIHGAFDVCLQVSIRDFLYFLRK